MTRKHRCRCAECSRELNQGDTFVVTPLNDDYDEIMCPACYLELLDDNSEFSPVQVAKALDITLEELAEKMATLYNEDNTYEL